MKLLTAPVASALATALLAACSLTGLTATTAEAAGSTTLDYLVDPHAGTHKAIPGTEVVFDAAAGTNSYLRATDLGVSNVDALAAGDNIGNTFSIRCRYADGTALPTGEEAGAYWATNLVPPGETSLAPILRWLFTAPTTDRYQCNLAVTSYSTIIKNGREVTMRIPAGAQLLRSQYKSGDSWTLPKAETTVLARGTSTPVMEHTYVPTGSGRTTVVMDAALTTCKPLSSLCAGGTSGYTGTQARTWIEAQPRNADGTPCGPLLKSTARTWSISTPKHHMTATNSLYIDPAQTTHCADLHLTMIIKNAEGNPLNIHAGWTTGTIAATHALAVTAA
ncbi:hypothetical protein [Streptomyces sp. NPDC017448]|uniref:hypothetical protein n=1 Tax=Streptomyces sp. NPDC017448 TaxID=3364996 RepID=UPI0037BBF3CE